MKTSRIFVIAAFCTAVLFTGCEKAKTDGTGGAPAIKVNISRVETKAKVTTDKYSHSTRTSDIYDFIEDNGFNMSAYVTAPWRRDQVGQSPEIAAGLYVDPGQYSGPYNESSYPSGGNKFEDITVTYDSTRDLETWRITGNDAAAYANHKFSWVNATQMNFFSYAPVTTKGTRVLPSDTTDGTPVTTPFEEYSFKYTELAASGDVPSTNCEDLIFAFNAHTATFGGTYGQSDYGKLVSGSTDTLNIKFYHALAQIRFCLSTEDGTYTPTTKLVSVKLKGPESTTTPGTFTGIPSSGTCVFDGTPANNAGRFTWTIPADAASYTYSQSFNASFASSTPTGWEPSEYGATGAKKNLYICSGDVLFVLPQSLSACAVEITVNDGGADSIITGYLPETVTTATGNGPVTWEAGMCYTYKIQASRNIPPLTLLPPEWIEGGNGPISF